MGIFNLFKSRRKTTRNSRYSKAEIYLTKEKMISSLSKKLVGFKYSIDFQEKGLSYKHYRKQDDGYFYEVYHCNSKELALQFLKSIPSNEIPPLYYIIVETSLGNFGKDLECIFDESTCQPIEIEEEKMKKKPIRVNLGEVRPQYLEMMIKAGQSSYISDSRGISEEISVDDMKCAMDAKQIMQQADEFAHSGDYKNARETYLRFISQANFEDDVAYYSLAGVSLILGYRDESEKYLKKAMQINPSNMKASQLLKKIQSGADLKSIFST